MTEEIKSEETSPEPSRIGQYGSDVGLERVIQKLRNNEFLRQAGAFVLIFFFTWTASPQEAFIPYAIAAVALGVLVRAWAAGTVFKNEILATTGPYSIVRHPLYVGNILVIVGFNLLNNEPWAWMTTGAFLWFFYPTAIVYEDSKLEGIFGQPWREWRARTPALIPARIEFRKLRTNWSVGLFAGRNGELMILLVILVCLVLAIRLG